MAASPPGLTCPPAGNLQSATAPNDGVQSGRFTRAGNPLSTCAAPHTAPVLQGGNYAYDKYVFTNRKAATTCISVTLQATGAAGNPRELQSAAYPGQAGFQPANITTNYLGDSGPGTSDATPTTTYSFNVASLADFAVVVTESNDGQGGAYNLTVAGCGEILINNLSPVLSDSAGGGTLILGGSGFVSGATVDVGGAAATNVVVSNDGQTLFATIPAHAATAPAGVTITVTNPSGGGSATIGNFVFYDHIPTTTILTTSKNPTVFGEAVTLTAQVTPATPNPGTSPPGNVTFFDGATPIGTAAVANSQAAIVVSTFGLGAHALTATYTQSPAPAPSEIVYNTSTSNTVNQQVNQSATIAAIASSTNPSTIGSTVTFTATIAATAPGAGVPTGTVSFQENGVQFATGTLNASGQATTSTSGLALGGHNITVVYSGDTNFTTSTSATLVQTVTADGTAITITATPASSTFGTSVTFTATLSSTTAGITGTVTFRDGAAVIGTAQTVSGNAASVTIATLAQGTHTISADYSGDVNHKPVTGSISYTVGAAATTTTLTSSVNPSLPGQTVTFTATVKSAVAGTIGGTVTFKDGTSTLGTGAVSAAGIATFTTTALAIGSHNITASYAGATGSNFGPSTSAVLVQVVRVLVGDGGVDSGDASSDSGKDSGIDASKPDATPEVDSGSVADSGVIPKRDSGSDAGDGVIAGGGGSDDGCGCTTAGTPSSSGLSVLMWVGVGLLVARRRKRNPR